MLSFGAVKCNTAKEFSKARERVSISAGVRIAIVWGAMGSVGTPPRGGVFWVRLPVFWEVIGGDVLQPLFFCDLSSLEP